MNDFIVYAMLMGALSSGDATPFWAQANQNGLVPQNCIALAQVKALKPLELGFAGSNSVGTAAIAGPAKAFQWQAGASFADALDNRPGGLKALPMVDELYAGIRWKVLGLDAGMMHRTREFLGSDAALGSLSVTEGHVVESNNARSMPGYSLVLEPWAVPFTKGHVHISGLWGDYKPLGHRFMDGALVHRLRGYLRYDIAAGFFVQLGLDHYALWAGSNPEYGTMPVTLGNYFRIATARKGTSEGSGGDQLNRLGDHGGAEQFRFGWQGEGRSVTFQWEKPYADKSGMRMDNFPDGVYTIHFSLSDKNRWVSDVLLEAHYTMWQSGTVYEEELDNNGNPLPPDERAGLKNTGCDNYFNNVEYRSGWTNMGRPICGPLFFAGPDERGYWNIRNNRYKALHLGVGGKFFRVAPYRLMLTAGMHYGTYHYPYVGESSMMSGWNWWERNTIDRGLFQFSAGLNGTVPLRLWGGTPGVSADAASAGSQRRAPRIAVCYGIFADFGKVLPHNLGATLGTTLSF